MMRLTLIFSMVVLGASLQTMTELQRLNNVVEEAQQRCNLGDIDGATQSLGIWFHTSQPSITTKQASGILNACLARHGFLGEHVGSAPKGSKCVFSEEQCTWAKLCLDNLDCPPAPLEETVAMIQQHSSVKRDDDIPEDAIVKPEPKGVWVDGCPSCNLAMTMKYLNQEKEDNQKQPGKKPGSDNLFWETIVPAIMHVREKTGDYVLDKNARSEGSLNAAKVVNKVLTEKEKQG